MGVKAPVTLRINPDVDAKTHAKITTGKSENKFGIDIDRAREIYARWRPPEGHQDGRPRRAYRLAADLASSPIAPPS